MKGTKLLGIPFGFSPIKPDGWAPTGLKYLSRAIFQRLSDSERSLRIFSITSFDWLYGLVGFWLGSPPSCKWSGSP